MTQRQRYRRVLLKLSGEMLADPAKGYNIDPGVVHGLAQELRGARDLGIHVNSMSYRVERIEAISGLQLDDPETRVAIAIALRARSIPPRRSV